LQKQKTPTFPEGQPYFARIEDAGFLADKERIKVLIDLNEYYECLYEVIMISSKISPRKKAAEVETGKHFGWSGKWFYLPYLPILNNNILLAVGAHWRPSLTAVTDGSCVAAFMKTQ